METARGGAAPATSQARAWRLVLAGGMVAGTLDILYAWVFWWLRAGLPFQRILQSVAAGLLGPGSARGGAPTAALGLVLHFGIATTMAGVYFVAARRWPVLARQPLRFGAVYGLGLYVVMNHVVVPLSAAGPGSADPLWVALSVAIHMGCIGIPIAVATHCAVRAPAGPPALPRTGVA
ncbi:MAG: hypothetical protein AB7O67_02295 [Vicinamibacterales bacterium]